MAGKKEKPVLPDYVIGEDVYTRAVIKTIQSKDLKTINATNQVCKKLFRKWVLSDDGMVFGSSIDRIVEKGRHFCTLDTQTTSDIIEWCDGPDIGPKFVEFLSAPVFEIVKDMKKDINALIMVDNKIFIRVGVKTYHVGNYYCEYIDDEMRRDHELAKYFAVASHIMKEDSSWAEQLLNNELVRIVSDEGYVARTTKELIPNLNNKNPVSAAFFDSVEGNPLHMHILLKTVKDKIPNYHLYTCLKY